MDTPSHEDDIRALCRWAVEMRAEYGDDQAGALADPDLNAFHRAIVALQVCKEQGFTIDTSRLATLAAKGT